MPTAAVIAELQSACVRHGWSPGQRVKAASLGGDGQDGAFEQAFANLAHAYLQDKAPTLLDYEIGFQLLDRNEDNTKAVGVVVFRVGSQPLYAPRFFLSGSLKGHELLYLPKQDLMVPLKENWLNYLLNRKPRIVGTGVAPQLGRLGVRQPDLQQLVSPVQKLAAFGDDVAGPIRGLHAHLVSRGLTAATQDFVTHCRERLDLEHFLKQAGTPAISSLLQLMRQRPQIAAAYDRWHGLDGVADLVKEAAAVRRTSLLDDSVPKYRAGIAPPAKQASPSLRIAVRGDSLAEQDGWTDADREQLIRNGIAVQDKRAAAATSELYADKLAEGVSNPDKTGLYDVLMADGTFTRCAVIMSPVHSGGRASGCLVIQASAPHDAVLADQRAVWVSAVDPGKFESQAWKDWYASLTGVSLSAVRSETSSDSEPQPSCDRPKFAIVTADGDGTCPFDLSCSQPQGASSVYSVYFDRHPARYGLQEDRPIPVSMSDLSSRGPQLRLNRPSGTELLADNETVNVPRGAKVLRLGDASDGHGRLAISGPDAVTSVLLAKTAELRVLERGGHYWINEDRDSDRPTALRRLMAQHGLRLDDAETVLKQAAVESRAANIAFRCRIKYAVGMMPGEGMGPTFPEEPTGSTYGLLGNAGMPVTNPYETTATLPETQAPPPQMGEYGPGPSPAELQRVQAAADSGQRELFDTAMITTLLKSTRDETIVDRYIPDLFKAVDRLGRLLFMFYAHQDRFGERFGDQELPQMEDALRSAFEDMGDLVLFLKQKTVEPYPEEAIRDLDLSPVAS